MWCMGCLPLSIYHIIRTYFPVWFIWKKTKYLCGWILHLQLEICCCLIIFLLLCSLHLWAKIWVCLFVFWEDQATWKEYWINTWLSPFLSVLSVISGFFFTVLNASVGFLTSFFLSFLPSYSLPVCLCFLQYCFN